MERQTYTYDEAFEASLQYFKGDELAARVWVNKYAVKDSFGNIFEKSPEDMHWRIANEVARIEAKYKNGLNAQQLYELLDHFKYIVPQGSPMTGIGNDFQVASLSNCFVIGIDGAADSYGGIIRIDEEQVQLMKRRGGVGHDLSHIRPKGSPVKNSALTSTGLVPFMERYSNSTREVAQDGRRGALMLSVSIKHPDSEAFIDAKMTEGKVTGANVSVKLDDAFMQAAVNGTPYKQQYPVDSDQPVFTKDIDASALWKKIVHNAWKSAEPGVLFWDTIIRESVPDCYADLGYRTVSTNPCGEIPLCPYDSCRLLAINLYSYVVNPYTKEAYFDFDLFKKHVALAQRIMDDIIDLELEKIEKIIAKIDSDPESEEVKEAEKHLWEKIYKKSGQGRRTGVGITAEGDMLAAMGLRYGTEDATEFSEQVHKTIALEAYRSSVNMAKERGAFAIYDSEREKNNPFINRLKEADPELYEEMKKYGRRNIACLTIAPTGTTSLMTQTTSGIEPVFMPVYKRRRKVNPNDPQTHVDFVDETGDAFEEYIVFHHKFVEWMTVNGYDPTKRYTQEEIDAGRFYTFGRIPNAGDIKYVPQREDVKYYGDLEANEDKSHAAISGEDRTIIGKDVPDFTYGVNLNLQWKNFELSVFGQGVSGTMTAFESEQISAFMLNANPREFHRGRWTQENPNPRAIYPRIYGGHSLDDYNQYFSDYQLFDSDYFRIKSISLGYMVPINVVKSWGLSSLKLFVTGENLFTLRADDKMKDFDPESPSGRGLSYLGSKSVAFGVNVSF